MTLHDSNRWRGVGDLLVQTMFPCFWPARLPCLELPRRERPVRASVGTLWLSHTPTAALACPSQPPSRHAGHADPQAAAADWRANAALQRLGLAVGVFPEGACLVGELPHCGPLSYLLCCLRAYPQLMRMAREGLCAKVSHGWPT